MAAKPNIYEPVAELCRLLGLDPELVRRLDVGLTEVAADVYKTTPNGEKYIDPASGEVAMETLRFGVLTYEEAA